MEGNLLTANAALEAPDGVLSTVDALGKLANSMDVKLASTWKDALKATSAVTVD
jgi:hypothetical protein